MLPIIEGAVSPTIPILKLPLPVMNVYSSNSFGLNLNSIDCGLGVPVNGISKLALTLSNTKLCVKLSYINLGESSTESKLGPPNSMIERFDAAIP